MTNAAGARIGDYWLDGEMAARSTEVAYRATHRILPRCARIAIVRPTYAGYKPAEVQLLHEACVLEAMHHSGVPRVFECGVLDRRPWIATELVEGTSIERDAAEHPLAIPAALAVLRDAAEVLAHAHRHGVVHRNVTPSAIVRTPSRSFPVCVIDWGDPAVDAAPDGRFYRAPELGWDSRCDDRADVFALGAVMFEAVTLVLPDPVQRFPGVPSGLYRLLAAMLARQPEQRPTASAVHAEASRLAEQLTEGDVAIEEVEVELIDISQAVTPMPNLGWMPPDSVARLASLKANSLAALPPSPPRRRRDP